MTELFYKKSRKNRIYLTGKRFGRLTVLEYAGTGKSGTFWKCKCDCGKITTILSHSLRSGRTTSCGCYNREVTSKRYYDTLKRVEHLQKKLAIATKALKKYQEAINRFKKDPMNNIIMLAHQLIYDIDIDSKKVLKEVEGVK